MDRSFHIIINPVGAGGKTLKCWNRIEHMFEEVPHQVHFSTLERGIEDICRELTKSDEEINLVVVGGDGSMNDAINGIKDFSKVRLGFLPCGSGNDLARDLALSSRSLEENVRMILKGRIVHCMDLGEVVFHDVVQEVDRFSQKIIPASVHEEMHRYFHVSCGIGYDAETCRQVSLSKHKKFLNRIGLGKLIYLAVGVKLIFASDRFPITILSDNQEETFASCLFAVAMNHRYEGGGFKFCPEAEDTDGKLDLCIAGRLSKLDFFRVLPHAYSGTHVRFDEVFQRRGESFRFKLSQPMWVHTDGEVRYSSRDISLSVLKQVLQMLN